MLESIDDGHDLRVFSDTLFLGSRDERPELVDVDGRSPVGVLHVMEVAHTDFTEITVEYTVKSDIKADKGDT